MKKSNILPSLVLGCICLVAALLLSVVNKFTAPIIEKNKNAAASGAFVEVLPGATGKEDITLDERYPATVKAGYKFDNGFVFQMEETGKASGFIIMVGIDLEGKVTGAKVISNQETPSYAANVFTDIKAVDNTYNGTTLDTFAPALVSGATLTSDAYGRAVKAALQSYVLASGGSVDTRTEEEKFQDACNELLGTTDLTYTNVFLTAALDGVSAVYGAEGSDDLIFKVGEKLIGIKADGTVVSLDATDDEKAKATAAHERLASVTTETVEIPEAFATKIASILVTNNGDYIIEAYGDGYGIKGGNKYHPASGKQIVVMFCISSTGEIIDSMTTFEEETPDFGGKLLKDHSFYEAYEGKTADDYASVPNVSGATYTSKGYKDALKKAFEVFETLTEGGND